MLSEPAIHIAVINDQIAELKKLAQDPNQLLIRNGLGFTPLEIACYLNKKWAVKVLNPHLLSKNMMIRLPEYHRTLEFNSNQFQKTFGVDYIRFLHFPNYKFFKQVIANRPYLLRSRLATENWELAEKYQTELSTGFVAEVIIQWVDDAIGYGIFANADFAKGTYIGEYTGLVKRLYRFHSKTNEFCLHYPTKFWSLKYFAVDALNEGNELRFINHSNDPNLDPKCLVDRGILHQVFITNRHIKKGEELLFNYGKDFWNIRKTKEK